jgi:hypothetical protein
MAAATVSSLHKRDRVFAALYLEWSRSLESHGLWWDEWLNQRKHQTGGSNA